MCLYLFNEAFSYSGLSLPLSVPSPKGKTTRVAVADEATMPKGECVFSIGFQSVPIPSFSLLFDFTMLFLFLYFVHAAVIATLLPQSPFSLIHSHQPKYSVLESLPLSVNTVSKRFNSTIKHSSLTSIIFHLHRRFYHPVFHSLPPA